MRSSAILVRPLVALLGAAFCAGAALAANYTLTNTTVEWPSSNEAENVSGCWRACRGRTISSGAIQLTSRGRSSTG